jgi:hypothetical protein
LRHCRCCSAAARRRGRCLHRRSRVRPPLPANRALQPPPSFPCLRDSAIPTERGIFFPNSHLLSRASYPAPSIAGVPLPPAAVASGRRCAWPGRVGPPPHDPRPLVGALEPPLAFPPLPRRWHGLPSPESVSTGDPHLFKFRQGPRATIRLKEGAYLHCHRLR